jgi:hypothetical protein
VRTTEASAGGLSGLTGDPRLLVAGGGGGGGGGAPAPSGEGGSAGEASPIGAGNGGAASCEGFPPAQPGSNGGLGAGGGLGGQEGEPISCTETASHNGEPGDGGQGGDGNADNSCGGGGGGGGYIGGGGGAFGIGGAGGGGGSSFGPTGSHIEEAPLGQSAEVTITYTMPAVTTTQTVSTSVTQTTTASTTVTQTATDTTTSTVSAKESSPPATGQTHGAAAGYSFTLTAPNLCVAHETTLDTDLTRSGSSGGYSVISYTYLIDGKMVRRKMLLAQSNERGRVTSYISLENVRPGVHELTVDVLLRSSKRSQSHSGRSVSLHLRFKVC